jgi:hypothetical protein
MWSVMFWKATAERAAKTFAQAFLSALGVAVVNLASIGWLQALSLAGFATLLSVLSSLASAGAGEPSSPSLVPGVKT